MNNKVYSFNKFTDSFIMYHKKTPKFLLILIVLICVSITGFITWSAFIVKPYIVKAQGIISVNDKSYVMPKTNGVIKEVLYNDGDTVEKGDIIIVLDSLEIDSKVHQLETTINILKERNLLFTRLIEYTKNNYSIDEEGHCFNQEDYYELEFYNYMASYLSQKDLYPDGPQKDIFKIETINKYLAEWNKIDSQIKDYESQKSAFTESKEMYYIKAESKGQLIFNAKLNVGMVVSAGANIGSVINNNDEIFIETYLQIQDRPKVDVGNSVKIAIAGLSQNEFGTVDGEVLAISNDAIVGEKDRYYLAKIKINNNNITNSKGEITKLLAGMGVESRIVYKDTTYLKYFLEQIGIKFN